MGGFLLSSTTNAIGIHPAAGYSTGRNIPQEAAERTQAGTYPEQAEEHQQEAAERSQAGIYRRRQRNINRRQRDKY